MKKIKSLLALFLLGSLTLAGCGKNTDDDSSGGETPSGETPSGDPSGGEEPSGGGGETVVDRFSDKKLVYDSYETDPEITDEEMKAEGAAYYGGTYAQFFDDGKFEYVLEMDSYASVLLGTYTLSEDKQTATVAIKQSASKYGVYDIPDEYQYSMVIPYQASSSKYVYTETVTEEGQSMTITVYYKDSGEKPAHYVFPAIVNYNVTFNANGGTGEMAADKTDESHYVVPGNAGFTRDGYQFVGWGLNSQATGADVYEPGDLISNIDQDIVLFAIWREQAGPDLVSVSFDSNGGVGTMSTIQVEVGGTIDLPQCTFTNEGMAFGGWSLSINGPKTYDDGQHDVEVTSSMMLYALWEDIPGPGPGPEPGPESLVNLFKLMGLNGDWEEGISGVDATDAEEVEEGLYVEQVKFEFEVGETPVEIKVSDGSTYLGYTNLDDGCKALAASGDEGNIRIEAAGEYELFLKKFANESFGLWLSKKGGEPEPTPGPGPTPEPSALVDLFKLLGLNGDWTVGESGVDATIPEEVEGGLYVEQVKFEITVAEEPVEVKVSDGSTYLGYSSLDDGCKALAASGDEGNIRIEAAGEYELYLKKFANESFGLWLSKKGGGEPEPTPEPTPEPSALVNLFKLMGLNGDWTVGESGVDSTIPAEVEAGQYVEQVKYEFTVGEEPVEVKVSDGSTYLGYSSLDDGCKALAASGDEGNIRIEAAGEYELFLKKFANESFGLWLSKKGGGEPEPTPEPTPEPSALVNLFKLMGLNGDWTVGESGVDSTIPAEVEAGQYVEQVKFEFEVGETPVEVKVSDGSTYLGYTNLDDGCKALAASGDEGNIRIETAGEYELYLKKFANESFGLWLSKKGGGEPEPTPEPTETITYTFSVTGDNAWVLNDEAKLYLWAFHREGEVDTLGHFYEGSVKDGVASFTIPSNLNMCVIVRSAGITDLTVWNGETPWWSKSNDLSISGSNTVLSPESWTHA